MQGSCLNKSRLNYGRRIVVDDLSEAALDKCIEEIKKHMEVTKGQIALEAIKGETEMNERIRELAERADFFLESNNEIRKCEKFAELLLDEFIGALEESNGTHSETSEYGLSILIGDIRKHFGMEEIT